MTPGLTPGLALTVSGLAILLAYLLIVRILRRYKKQPVMAVNDRWPEKMELEENWTRSDEIDREFIRTHSKKKKGLDEEALEQAAAEEEMAARRNNMFEKASDQGGFTVDISAAEADEIDLNSESFRPETIADGQSPSSGEPETEQTDTPAAPDGEPEKQNETGAEKNE